jgi:hypothetical protein
MPNCPVAMLTSVAFRTPQNCSKLQRGNLPSLFLSLQYHVRWEVSRFHRIDLGHVWTLLSAQSHRHPRHVSRRA